MQFNFNLFEKSARDNHEFPFYVYKLKVKENETVISPHWHDELEILYFQADGICELNNEVVKCKFGDIVFSNKEVIHRVISNQGGCLYAIVFDFSFLDFYKQDFFQAAILDKLETKNLTFPSKIIANTELYYETQFLIREIIELYFSDTLGREFKIKCDLYNILFLFYNKNQFIISSETEIHENKDIISYIRNTTQYIEQNFQSKITIKDLAKNVNLSSFYLIKIFKDFTGVTPIQYLLNLRLEYAKNLLKHNANITEVCFNCGFNDLSYFIRKFKNKYLITPNEYKKNR